MESVEFRPHIGRNCKTGSPVNHGQYLVFLGSRQVGILRDKAGSIFCPIVDQLTTLEEKAIADAAEQQLNWRPKMGRIVNVEATEIGRKAEAEQEAMEMDEDDDDE